MAARRALKPRKKPIQDRSRFTVDAILEASAQVFERHGHARATTDRIAKRAGVSVGSLYQYFPNKDAILVALASRHVDAGLALVERCLTADADRPLDQLLRDLVEALIDQHAPHPRLHHMLLEQTLVPNEAWAELESREEALAERISGLLEAHPEVHVRDARLAAWLVIHVGQGLVHDFVTHPPHGNVDRDTFVEEAVRLLSAYLGAYCGHPPFG